jgi:hypothetical protein
MAFQIFNTLRGSSIITGCDPGTATIALTDLRANATTETVSAADIRRISWSTNGSITLSRNGFPLLALHSAGEMRFDDFGAAINSNNGSSMVITITTGGTFVMEVAKVATYNVDPYTGVSLS